MNTIHKGYRNTLIINISGRIRLIYLSLLFPFIADNIPIIMNNYDITRMATSIRSETVTDRQMLIGLRNPH